MVVVTAHFFSSMTCLKAYDMRQTGGNLQIDSGG